MFTSVVGKTFLKEFNNRNSKNYSAKEFFDQVLFKLFFDHEKYLIWAQNSPFVQGISKKKPFFEPNERQENLEKFHAKIADGDRDASIAIGFPASETKEFATTSGLVTDLVMPTDEDEVYYSWIGGTLSLGVAGGYAILFDDPEITYATFEGWEVYRKYLNDPALSGKLLPNKIISWNGQWLTYRMSKWYRADFDFSELDRQGFFDKGDAEIKISTIEWSKLFFSLSNSVPEGTKTAYIFSLGQTNKTIGFIPFQFKSGRRLYDVYKKLFGEESFLKNATVFESLFGRHIKRACELGNIGLQALEPKDLRKYFADTSNIKFTDSSIEAKKNESEEDFQRRKADAKAKEQEDIITFQTYKTWLIAMLSKNKQEISDYTRDIAAALVRYREGARKLDRKTLLEKRLFATKQKNQFLEALIDIVNDTEVDLEIVEKVKDLRDKIHFMSKEDFTYFILLLKFDYAYQERIS